MPTGKCKWCNQESLILNGACSICLALYQFLDVVSPAVVEKMIREIAVNRFMIAKAKEK